MSELFKNTNKFLNDYNKNLEIESSKLYQILHDGGYSVHSGIEEFTESFWRDTNDYYDFIPAEFEYNSIIKRELKELNDSNTFFYCCKFKTYAKTYNERLDAFLVEFEDAESINFLQDEFECYSKPIRSHEVYRELNQESYKKLNFTRDKTLKFIVNQAKQIGYHINDEGDGFEKMKNYNIEEIKETENFTITDLGELRGTEKILMLHELGIIDFLKTKEPFNLSNNSLATIIGSITGEKATTIQSYLNPILSPKTIQKNNPLKSKKTLEIVTQKLISIGFKSTR
jgi:hypothetical protein